MTYEPDLPRYFERIGYRGSTAPTLAHLNAILLAHVCSIPFENLDVWLGRPVSLEPAQIEDKLVGARRGGYCFEQNTLLSCVLRALGYPVTPISARVRLGRPREETPPRTHMFLRVELPDGSWLVDAGVGRLSPTAALRLALDEVQETPHEPRRLCREGDWAGLALRGPSAKLYHQAFFDGAWHDVCEFTLETMPEIDRELGNWYTSTHPGSRFKSQLMVARATPEGRTTLLDRQLTWRRKDGSTRQRELCTAAELIEVLEREFGIALPPGVPLAFPRGER